MSQRRAKQPLPLTVEQIAYCNKVYDERDPEGAAVVQEVLTSIAKQSDNPTSSLIGMAMGLCVQGMKHDREVLEYCQTMLNRIRSDMRELLDEREAKAADRLRAESGT